ncbi:hypothetical protein EYF80_008565 [Liparis tanakae]|uniref:Uncharacterized protein n=1 Tax=Liparis tanakae TaxID=230148 RepID=A0A4Z2ITT4_9TELE|nr:hypothetical protein EYF80_008565 [Liparis tanakae]
MLRLVVEWMCASGVSGIDGSSRGGDGEGEKGSAEQEGTWGEETGRGVFWAEHEGGGKEEETEDN